MFDSTRSSILLSLRLGTTIYSSNIKSKLSVFIPGTQLSARTSYVNPFGLSFGFSLVISIENFYE